MTEQEINESSSIIDNEKGMIYCCVCKAPKDDSGDDCACMYNFPRKRDE